MELVYLWVEKYKNIKEQGFNFSPRFECSYDGENLTITPTPEKEIENFFGKNINITAIVGENGSGKSSVSKLIFLLLYCKNYDMEYNPIHHENIIDTVRNFTNKELFLIFYDSKNVSYSKISMKYFIKSLVEKKKFSKPINMGEDFSIEDILFGSEEVVSKCSLPYDEIEKEKIKTFFIHFNYMLDTFYDGTQDKWIKDIYHKADSYQTPLLLEPYKNNNGRQLIDLELIEYLNSQKMLNFFSIFNKNKSLVEFFKSNIIKFKIANRVINEDEECLSKIKDLIAYKFYQLYYDNNIFLNLREEKKEKICRVFDTINKLYEDKNYLDLTYLYIALKVLKSKENLFQKDEYQRIKDWATKLENENDILKFKNDIKLKNLISANAPKYEVKKIQLSIDFIDAKIYDETTFKENINKPTDIDKVKEILKFIPPWLDVEWFEDEKSINSLSSGEKSFFTFIINLMYQVQNINQTDDYNRIIIFLDETELGLHPQWQKEYLSKIVLAINQINTKKVNLIFATHSPFLISDLPKENVIFLDTFNDGKDMNKEITQKKYPKVDIKNLENGNCINVSDYVEINPFGANIHTLLSDGFFMNGGLMGEFAKGKINEIVKFYNDVKEGNKTEKKYDEVRKEFYFIRDNIGEKYLQGIITNHIEFIEETLGDKSFKEKKEISYK